MIMEGIKMRTLGKGYTQINVLATQQDKVLGFNESKNEYVVATFDELQESYFWSHYFRDREEVKTYCLENELMELAKCIVIK